MTLLSNVLNKVVKQSAKLHNAATFQMLHRVLTFDEKQQNLPTLAISYNMYDEVIKDTKKRITD